MTASPIPKFDPIELGPLEARLAMLANGYEPIPVAGKRPLIDFWQSRAVNEEVVRTWDGMGPNTGMRTARTPVFDIDILDKDGARVVENVVLRRLGDKGAILLRVGLLPKRAILTRTETPFPKIARTLVSPDGNKHKIEVLGDGQQVVVAGTHPDTGKQYAWRWGHSPITAPREKLPLVDEHEAHSIVDECVDELFQLGWTLAGGSSAGAGDADNIVPFTPISERIEKMQYGGEFPINDTLLAYSGDELRNGVIAESAIKDCLARAQKAYDEIPGDPQERSVWDWTKMRQQIEAMVYGYIEKNYKDSPRLIDALPTPMLEKWRKIEQLGGAPVFKKRRYWGVEDSGPADPLPEMEPPPETARHNRVSRASASSVSA
jgi:Bifunctional DNA primase/polymerase, N-terminal